MDLGAKRKKAKESMLLAALLLIRGRSENECQEGGKKSKVDNLLYGKREVGAGKSPKKCRQQRR